MNSKEMKIRKIVNKLHHGTENRHNGTSDSMLFCTEDVYKFAKRELKCFNIECKFECNCKGACIKLMLREIENEKEK